MELTEKQRGLALIVGATVLWSFSGVCVKRLGAVNPMAISGFRSLFAVPVLWLFLRSPADSGQQATGERLLPWGVAGTYALTLVLFIVATCWTTAANAIFLQYTSPVHVSLLSWFLLRESVSRREWFSLVLCLSGLACVFGSKLGNGSIAGDVVALLAGITWGLHILLVRKGRHGGSPRRGVLMGNLLVVFLCLPVMILNIGTIADWGMLAFLGIVQLAIPFLLFLEGMKRVSAVEGATLTTLEAVFNPIWTAWGAGEIPGPLALGGGGLILTAAILAARRSSNHRRSEAASPASEDAW